MPPTPHPHPRPFPTPTPSAPACPEPQSSGPPRWQVRFAVLNSGKTLVTPQPRLRTGFFSRLHRDGIPPDSLLEACTSGGPGTEALQALQSALNRLVGSSLTTCRSKACTRPKGDTGFVKVCRLAGVGTPPRAPL